MAIGRTNVGGGGKAFAVISATYPAGSTCTCTNGTKTLKAKETSGSFLFLIPEAGAWTVSCTDGTDTTSKNVDITEQYQTENVILSYRVPPTHQEVEYIQTSGSQYIKLGLSPNNIDEVAFSVINLGTPEGHLLSCYDNGNHQYYARFTDSGRTVDVHFDNINIKLSALISTLTIGRIIVSSTSVTATVDNVTKTGTGTNAGSSRELYIFASNDSLDGAWAPIPCKFISMEIYKNGVPVSILAPCYRKSDNVAGLWDSIRGLFLTNAGAGTFIVGGDVA